MDRTSAIEKQRRRTFAALLIPAIVVICVVNLYPIGSGILASMYNGTLLNIGEYVGINNYIDVLTQGRVVRALSFTAIYTFCGVAGSWIIGFSLAIYVESLKGRLRIVRTALLLPWIVPVIVSATAWNWLFGTPRSFVPDAISYLGLQPPLFLAEKAWAIATVCAFKVWLSFPFMLVTMGAALKGIDSSVYEAARVDGANKKQLLRYIIVPLTMRTTYVSCILMTIFCVNDYPTIFLLTGGGPVDSTTSLIILAYQMVFQEFQTGPGTALALVVTAALGLAATLALMLMKKSYTES